MKKLLSLFFVGALSITAIVGCGGGGGGGGVPAGITYTGVTTQALKIVLVDAERNLLGVHGAVPGGKGGLVLIQEARKQ